MAQRVHARIQCVDCGVSAQSAHALRASHDHALRGLRGHALYALHGHALCVLRDHGRALHDGHDQDSKIREKAPEDSNSCTL